jgi:hypothetical protein
MEKLFVRRILCISYMLTGDNSGKLRAMMKTLFILCLRGTASMDDLVKVIRHAKSTPFRSPTGGMAAAKPNQEFCFIMKHLPACLRIGFQNDDQNEKKVCSLYEQTLLKTS